MKLFNADLAVQQRDWLEHAFQSEPGAIEYLKPPCPPEDRPRIIIATSRTVSTGLAFIRVNHPVKLAVEVLDGYDT